MTRPEITDMAGSDIPDMASRKTRRTRTEAIAKRYEFYSNSIIANLFQINTIVIDCGFLSSVSDITLFKIAKRPLTS